MEATGFTCFSYDWVVADLGHGLSPATLALAAVADTLFVVTTAEIAVLHQLKRVLRRLADAGLSERTRLVLNRLRKEQQFYREEFETVLSKPFEVILPEDVAEIEEAHAERRVVSARSGIGKGIEALTAKVSGIAPEQKPRSRFSVFR